ncbi:MAG TPA: SDR family oxidoreductase [Aestuariivirgaceae bacterium]|nr:SDR family oxidoreductase [Aestuariivirgaceae bacterium]
MDLMLNDKIALVCGASQGLGLAIARGLAAENVSVALLARNADKLEAEADAIRKAGGRAVAAPADLGDWDSVAGALDAVRAEFGAPDILVNNSGPPPPVDVTKVDPDLWRAQFEAMMLTLMRLTEAVLPDMRKRGFGRILTVASTSIVEPIPALAISNALRAGLALWMKTLAGQVAGDGVTVNLVLPGSFATARLDSMNARKAEAEGIPVEDLAARASAAIPAKRYGRPDEFADITTFLASPRAGYVTGTAVRIDGGNTGVL